MGFCLDKSLLKPPSIFFHYLRAHEITNIIRLCEPKYDAEVFTNCGFQHDDLYFEDGAVPSDDVVQKFFEITENAKGAIAVHCNGGCDHLLQKLIVFDESKH